MKGYTPKHCVWVKCLLCTTEDIFEVLIKLGALNILFYEREDFFFLT